MAMRLTGRTRRALRIRRKVEGTTERPRLTVFRTAKHIYAQVVNDETGVTLAHASTLTKDLRASYEQGAKPKKVDQAKRVGALIAKICLEKKIDRVVFDRNGFMYHGRIVALADAAREAGLKF